MKKNRLRKKIESLNKQIKKHEEKIAAEQKKMFPDEVCMRHWGKEIITFKRQIEKARSKLEA